MAVGQPQRAGRRSRLPLLALAAAAAVLLLAAVASATDSPEPSASDELNVSDDITPVGPDGEAAAPSTASASSSGARRVGPNSARQKRLLKKLGPIKGEYLVFYKNGVLGIEDKTKSLVRSVARTMTEAARADASVPAREAAAAAAPFSLIQATDVELGELGEVIPHASAAVQLHGVFAGSEPMSKRVIDLISQHPDVDLVVPHMKAGILESAGGIHATRAPASAAAPEPAAPAAEVAPAWAGGEELAGGSRKLLYTRWSNTTCGPWRIKKCQAAGLCCSSDATCGNTAQHCGSRCQVNYGACNIALPREKIYNNQWGIHPLPGKMTFMAATEAGWGVRRADTVDNLQDVLIPVDISTNRTLLNPAVDQTPVAVVIDSGIGPHTQLNIIGGRDFTLLTLNANRNKSSYWKDLGSTSHGTHVSGTVAAKGGWGGPWGVMPGGRLFSAMVEYPKDVVTNYATIEALRFILANCLNAKYAVVNMSIYFYGALQSSSEASKMCDLISRAANKCGTVFVACAGNAYKPVDPTIAPQSCPHVIVVTSLSQCTVLAKTTSGALRYLSCTAGDYSNYWQPATDTLPNMRRTLAAVGDNILSTLKGNAVGFLTGTSMASPQVAGIAMRCFVARDCVLGDDTANGGMTNRDKILDPAYERIQLSDSNKWNSGDGLTATKDDGTVMYLGPLAWANHW